MSRHAIPAPMANAAAGFAAALAFKSSTNVSIVDCTLDLALSTKASFISRASYLSSDENSE
jgi:hypothetical protein